MIAISAENDALDTLFTAFIHRYNVSMDIIKEITDRHLGTSSVKTSILREIN